MKQLSIQAIEMLQSAGSEYSVWHTATTAGWRFLANTEDSKSKIRWRTYVCNDLVGLVLAHATKEANLHASQAKPQRRHSKADSDSKSTINESTSVFTDHNMCPMRHNTYGAQFYPKPKESVKQSKAKHIILLHTIISLCACSKSLGKSSRRISFKDFCAVVA